MCMCVCVCVYVCVYALCVEPKFFEQNKLEEVGPFLRCVTPWSCKCMECVQPLSVCVCVYVYVYVYYQQSRVIVYIL